MACGWETTAGCPLAGRDAAASGVGGSMEGVGGAAHVTVARRTLFPLLAPVWIMDSARVRCQDAISYS